MDSAERVVLWESFVLMSAAEDDEDRVEVLEIKICLIV